MNKQILPELINGSGRLEAFNDEVLTIIIALLILDYVQSF